MLKPTKVLDLRGVVCPMNVIIIKRELRKGSERDIYQIIVDFPAAKEDVPKAIRDEGYKILEMKEKGSDLEIYVSKV